MAAHTKEQFELFMSQLRETNATLDFYCDFPKIARNVADIEISLNTLNYLIGKDDLRTAVEALWNRDKRVFDIMDILIATRKKDNKKYVDNDGSMHPIHSLFNSVDGVMKFLEGTGLDKVLKNQEIKDLVDYVFGVETGLDTNARKNRSGDITETLVARIFDNAGISYSKQVSSNEYPAISQALGADQKVFDFVIQTEEKIYLIEVNFYSSGGSKLNEVARSYTDVAPKVNSVHGYEFVWITDGEGWTSAKNKLEEAFATIPSIYNLTTIQEFIKSIKY
ncbi:MAG: type II restriction endonuclease [Paludibacteraceae bacterium]|nr:type II restriction endonuclease [Paludibacteraceae bacterium]